MEVTAIHSPNSQHNPHGNLLLAPFPLPFSVPVLPYTFILVSLCFLISHSAALPIYSFIPFSVSSISFSMSVLTATHLTTTTTISIIETDSRPLPPSVPIAALITLLISVTVFCCCTVFSSGKLLLSLSLSLPLCDSSCSTFPRYSIRMFSIVSCNVRAGG